MVVVVVRVHLFSVGQQQVGRRGAAAVAAAARTAVVRDTGPEGSLALEPLLDLPAVDAVLAGGRPLVAFAVAIIAVRLEHLDFEVWREYATRSHFVGGRYDDGGLR